MSHVNTAFYLNQKLAQLKAQGATINGQPYTNIAQVEAAIRGAGLTVAQHFTRFGDFEGLSPNANFDVQQYLAAKAAALNANGGTAPNGTNWTADLVQIAFNQAGLGVWQHFANFGSFETAADGSVGINPSNSFDISQYYADKAAALNAAGTAVPSGAATWTAKEVADVFKANNLNAIGHFIDFGAAEGLAAKAVPTAERVAGGSNTGANVGTTFTLTVNQDNVNGTANDDTINAPAAQDGNGTLTNSVQSVDIIAGGAGNDTLNATIAQAGVTAAPSITGVETVNARMAAAGTLDLANATGVTTVNVAQSTSAGTVSNVGTLATLGIQNQNSAVTIGGAAAFGTTVALNFDTFGTATNGGALDLGATKAAAATTANITTNNSTVTVDSTIADVFTTATIAATGTNTLTLTDSAATLTTVTVTGAGSLNLSGATLSAVTAFNGSASTGAINATLQNKAAAVAATTGAGADTLNVSAVAVTGSSAATGAGDDTVLVGANLASFTKNVDGGAGTDTINITDGSKLTATTAKTVLNFETLDVSGGTGSYDVSLNSFATVQADQANSGSLAGAVTFANAADSFTFTVASTAKSNADYNLVNSVTVTGKDYTGTTAAGTAETFTLVANMRDGNADNTADGNINAQTITVAGVENLVVNSNVTTLDGGTKALNASTHILTAEFVAAAAEKLTITGDAGVNLQATSQTLGVASSVDASASKGNVTLNLTKHATALSYQGSAGVDTFTAGTAGSTIAGNGGADVISVANSGAARDTIVIKSAADSKITDTNTDTKITTGADTGFDAVTGFTVGGTNTSDRLDVTNFAFTGTQRGVVNVTTKVTATTDLTSITDLFADVAGDRGVAFANIGGNSFVFIDANKDGNFTAADDAVVQLTGVASISEVDVNF